MEAALDIVIDPTGAQQGSAAVKRALDDVKQAARGASSEVDDFVKRQLALMRQEAARLAPPLQDAAAATSAVGASSAVTLAQVTALGSGVALLTGLWVRAAVSTANYAEEIVKASQQSTIATGTTQDLKYIADQTGTSFATLMLGLRGLNKNMAEVVNQTGDGSRLFKAIGVDVQDAGGKMRATDQVLFDMADRFASMRNEAAKAALANKFFGESGDEMLRIMNLGRPGIEAYIEAHRRLGKTLSEEEIQQAIQFKQELRNLDAATTALSQSMGVKLLPALTATIGLLTKGSELMASPAGKALLQVLGGTTGSNVGYSLSKLMPNAPGAGALGFGGGSGPGAPPPGGPVPDLPDFKALTSIENDRFRQSEEIRKKELDNLKSWYDLKRQTAKHALNEETGDEVEQAQALRGLLDREFADVQRSFLERKSAIVGHYATLKQLAAGNKNDTVKVEQEKAAALTKLSDEFVHVYLQHLQAGLQADDAVAKAKEGRAQEYWAFITRLEIEGRERTRRLTLQSAEYELQSFQGTLAERRTLLDQSATLERAIIQRDLQRRQIDESQAARLLIDLQRSSTTAALTAVHQEIEANNRLTVVKIEQATSEEERRAARNAGLLKEQELLIRQQVLIKQINIDRVQGEIQTDQTSELVRNRQKQGIVLLAQAELDATTAGYASFEELASRRASLLQAQYDKEISQVNLTEKEKLAIRISFEARIRQQTQLAQGDVLTIYRYGLQEYLTNTGNTFNIAIDMARETANAMSGGFKTLFVDVLKSQMTDVKSILTGVRDFAYNIIAEVAARLATAGLLRSIAGTSLGGLLGNESISAHHVGDLETGTAAAAARGTANPALLGPGFARGGIFTPVERYDLGGIAHRPQMAIFGEGSQSEAYVPLPDGRSIPVTLRMPQPPVGQASVTQIVNRLSIQVINQHPDARVQARERPSGDGTSIIELLITKVDAAMKGGTFDRTLQTNFGVRRQGGAR